MQENYEEAMKMINANFSSLVSFDWRSTIDTFDIKCTGDVGMEDLPESQIWV